MRKLKNSELNRKSVEEFKQSEKNPIIIVLDNVRSMNNIGSVFRTSDALLIDSVYLCGITATPPHRDLHKTALGAEDSVQWEYFKDTEDALTKLREKDFEIYSVEQAENSISLEAFNADPTKKYALIFGNEIKGVQQKIVDLSDGCIEIPQYGTKHSFNISVSCGIVLWDLFAKLKF
ncbi:RNA methyltransferase [Ancylomarina longa]|uniref:TrmH family RNA methyltransferase n=1 Tax=Ancylomarina longa TaxID=2487017 RepID=A0A434AVE2_9BACT|nr:RNA methyltransferase [Ancylomarina longa]RUT78451.1 TrmH family RNA methyltransferase [Ancylomarina longa]